ARTVATGRHNSDSAALLMPSALAPPSYDHRLELQRRRLSSGPLAVHHWQGERVNRDASRFCVEPGGVAIGPRGQSARDGCADTGGRLRAH
ncbi:hypothetical protein, partial [Paraburkholderia aspalathi]|uniref:hypothetical protein n=2 Tax=Paraburkholderia aspalathi TaxID=1324617 RepID=UPI001BA598F5